MRLALIVFAIGCVTLPLNAQRRCPAEHAPSAGGPRFGLVVGVPLGLSFYAGGMYEMNCNQSVGILLEPGLGGASAGIGYDFIGRTQREGVKRIQASVMRTWVYPVSAPAGRWYAGAEFQYSMMFGGRVGLFRQLSKQLPRKNLFTAGFVVGF